MDAVQWELTIHEANLLSVCLLDVPNRAQHGLAVGTLEVGEFHNRHWSIGRAMGGMTFRGHIDSERLEMSDHAVLDLKLIHEILIDPFSLFIRQMLSDHGE